MRSALPLFVAPLLLLTACAGDDEDTMGGTTYDPTATATNGGSSATITGTTSEESTTGDSDSSTSDDTTTTGDATSTTTTGSESTSTTTGEPTTTDDPTTTTDDPTTTTGIMPDPDQIPPMDSNDALLAWLGEGSYTEWNAESGIHQSTGPHGGQVRTFLNDALYDSFDMGLTSHPEGAVAVKELWGNGDNIIGWAVEIKVQADSDGGNGWYWYEKINQSEYGGQLGLGLCTGCHGGGGVDYVLTPWPLQ